MSLNKKSRIFIAGHKGMVGSAIYRKLLREGYEKIIVADRLSVRLSYDAHFKWHMPICVERCRAEQKYMPLFGTVTERAFRKKNPKHRNIYK